MNCVHPQINQIRNKFDKFMCNRARGCLHSITLASLTSLHTPGINDLVRKEMEQGRGQSSRTAAPCRACSCGVASPWLPRAWPPLSVPYLAAPSPASPQPAGARTRRPCVVLVHAQRRPRHPRARLGRPPPRASVARLHAPTLAPLHTS